MIKYILTAGILLLLLIIVTVWYSVRDITPTPATPETYAPLPIAPVTVLETPKNFDELLPSTPTNLFQNVLNQMHLDTYIVISCKSSQGRENAILITAKYVESESGNNFNAAIKAVSDWETSMLVDVGKIIFPSILSNEINQPVVFSPVANTSYRIAPVTVNSQSTALHYGWQNNYVVFASTKECLGEILRTVQDGA